MINIKTAPELEKMRNSGEIPYVAVRGEGKRYSIRYEPEQVRSWARAGGCRRRKRGRKKK